MQDPCLLSLETADDVQAQGPRDHDVLPLHSPWCPENVRDGLRTVCSSNVSEIVVRLSIARMAICIPFIIGWNGVFCIVLDCNWFIGDLIDKVGDSNRRCWWYWAIERGD